jgi:hypothetical protein
MSLEKQKRELEYEIEHEKDSERLKLLKEALKKVLKLIDEMHARMVFLMDQSMSVLPIKPFKSTAALSILSILAIKNSRALYAIFNAENLTDDNLWSLIALIAREEACQGQGPFGLANDSLFTLKLSDWQKMRYKPPKTAHGENIRRTSKP